jgi:hypothetical protein
VQAVIVAAKAASRIDAVHVPGKQNPPWFIEMERTGIEPATSWLQTTHTVVSHPTICRILEGNRASVSFPSVIRAVPCRDKPAPKLTLVWSVAGRIFGTN